MCPLSFKKVYFLLVFFKLCVCGGVLTGWPNGQFSIFYHTGI